MKKYFIITIVSVAFIIGISMSSYPQDETQRVNQKELAKEAKSDVKPELTTKTAKSKEMLAKKGMNAEKTFAQADKKVDKKTIKK